MKCFNIPLFSALIPLLLITGCAVTCPLSDLSMDEGGPEFTQWGAIHQDLFEACEVMVSQQKLTDGGPFKGMFKDSQMMFTSCADSIFIPQNLSTQKLTAAQLYARNVDGVIEIIHFRPRGEPHPLFPDSPLRGMASVSSTGFAIAPGVIVTNHHIVKAAESGYLLCVDKDKNVYYPTALLAYDVASDIAVFQMNRPLQSGACLHASMMRPPVGADVYSIAHPGGYRYYLMSGHISQYYNSNLRYRMNVSFPIAGGASGGPVFDHCGNVIGVLSSTHTLYSTFQQGQSRPQMVMSNTIPISILKLLMPKKQK